MIQIDNFFSILYFEILDPPSDDAISIETSKSGPLIDNADTVTLTCDADSNPAPEITWLRTPPGQVRS